MMCMGIGQRGHSWCLQDHCVLVASIAVALLIRALVPVLSKQATSRAAVETIEELLSCTYITLALVLAESYTKTLMKRLQSSRAGDCIRWSIAFLCACL